VVDFLPTPEQERLIEAVRDFLANELPVSRLSPSRIATSRQEPDFWTAFADMGWFGLALPESIGGTGYSIAEEILLFRECGRFLVSPGIYATVLAARIAAASQSELLPRLLSGEVRASFLVPIGQAKAGPVANGEFFCLAPERSDLFLAWNELGAGIYPARTAVDSQAGNSLDEVMAVQRVLLRDTEPLAWLPVERENLPLRAAILVAAQLSGNCEATRDMAVAYAKLREQFGQPIGSFQAIKHRCADMAVRAEAAWWLTVLAALALREGHSDVAFQTASAHIVCSDHAIKNAAANVQIHGGIGFTSECPAHHFLKRAHVLDFMVGGIRKQQSLLLGQAAAA
jgi:alkylation response protein AidB-like acyl-CoA dehydrogenase